MKRIALFALAIRQPSTILTAGLVLLASLLSCQPEGPTEPTVTGISLAKGGGKKSTASYSVTELPPHTGANNASFADDLNEVGQIVGSSNSINEPTLWRVNEANGEVTVAVTALDMASNWFYAAAVAISNTGIAVGVFSDDGGANSRAVYWDVAASSATSHPLTGSSGRAWDVAALGGGFIVVGSQDRDAVYWENGGAPIILPPISPGALSRAKAINLSGTIAGESDRHSVVWHPVDGGYGPPCVLESNSSVDGMSEPTETDEIYVAGRWNVSVDGKGAVWKVNPSTCNQKGTPRHLDFLSRLYDVNVAGDAVGADLVKHQAILWMSDTEPVQLPGLGKGGRGGIKATSIRSDGKWIVGSSRLKKGARAVIWIRN